MDWYQSLAWELESPILECVLKEKIRSYWFVTIVKILLWLNPTRGVLLHLESNRNRKQTRLAALICKAVCHLAPARFSGHISCFCPHSSLGSASQVAVPVPGRRVNSFPSLSLTLTVYPWDSLSRCSGH